MCTTEFIAFAQHHPEFQKLNCDLLGLSIDSYYSHVAWVRNIKEKFGVEIPFPIIEDLSMKVANDYGMIHPGAADTSAVRATFVIDDNGILRAMVYYPITNGRSIPEFLRLVTAGCRRRREAHERRLRVHRLVLLPEVAVSNAAKARPIQGGLFAFSTVLVRTITNENGKAGSTSPDDYIAARAD